MPKRDNPFLGDFFQQSKMHIGIKQFNNKDERLKDVYKRTLQLLFRGSRKSFVSHEVIPNPNSVIQNHSKVDKMKQLFINKDGTLQNCGPVMNQEHLSVMCKCGRPACDTQCEYCELVLCTNCAHVCSVCSHPHCARCLLVGSSRSADDADVCLSCYT